MKQTGRKIRIARQDFADVKKEIPNYWTEQKIVIR